LVISGRGFVAGFFGAEGVFEVDSAPVDDRHEQDEGVDGFVADIGDPSAGILGMSLQLTDGPIELADFFSEFIAGKTGMSSSTGGRAAISDVKEQGFLVRRVRDARGRR
jgi:hypothetical protein